MPTKYTKEYFIEKFEAIPEEQWCVGNFVNFDGQRCAGGHCGVNRSGDWASTPEAIALYNLFRHVFSPDAGSGPAVINDGRVPEFPQSTPKQRILAALRSLSPDHV